MIHFECDYTQGFEPKVLQALVETNMVQTCGYGKDVYCQQSEELVQRFCGRKVKVHHLVGGTQTNATVIQSLLHAYQGVISCDTGHINTHETGAIEHTGHKVITLRNRNGKLSAFDVERYMNKFENDSQQEHVVCPKMIYISQPTELGTMYSLDELKALADVAKRHNLYFFMDGARLGYGLAADPGITLKDYADLLDVFYIGLTKCGAGFGEVVVFQNDSICPAFRSYMKQSGSLLAKGRLLGVQAYTLLKDNYYQEICKRAVDYAEQIRQAFQNKGVQFFIENNTNQIFPILTHEQIRRIKEVATVTDWEVVDTDTAVIRIVTSWGNTQEEVNTLLNVINQF